jgi:hypothetical protein
MINIEELATVDVLVKSLSICPKKGLTIFHKTVP